MADPAPYLELPAFYQRKRDLFRAGLAQHALRAAAQRGQLLPVRRLSRRSATWAKPTSAAGSPREIGVAAIPLSAFYADGFEQRIVRFCFAKKDETLQTALERLARL